jgi:hypothetical protein
VRRIALSAWSAGYGAITKIIDSQKNADRIDALLMLDGMHVSYLDPKRKTDLDPLRLDPLLRAAKEAAEGRKLFTITHSDIKPPDYASVAETADALLGALAVERVPRRDEPLKVALTAAVGVVAKDAERRLQQTSEARRGGLHVRGYAGETAEDHMAHLLQMSATVLPELAERWTP